ncbi:hypothetical protein F4803DRAFT_538738 [Xylaria telfairii]|nr:hypothetical protein F4803DRAFT_538738 [Xylaria telfairii]
MGAYSSRVETWALYATGSLIIFTRIGCRWKMVGLSGFKPDDYLIFISWATYTVMTYAADVVGGVGDLHALPLDKRKALSPEEAQSYIYATKWFCIGVATYNLFIWTLKLNFLFLYQRLLRGLWVAKLIKPTMALLGVSFIGIYIALFAACRPYNRMWIVYPDQGPFCQPQSTLNMAVPLALNIFTDLIIASIPASTILKIQTTFWKRIGLIFLFGAIAFIIVAAILRVVMVLVYKSGPVAAIWSCREDLVAILVGQFFMIRPIFRKSFWTRTRGRGTTNLTSKNSNEDNTHGKNFDSRSKWSHQSKHKDPYSVTVALTTVNDDTNPSCDNMTRESVGDITSSSMEYPNTQDKRITHGEVYRNSRNPGCQDDMVIYVTKHIQVDETATDKKGPDLIYPPAHTLAPTNRVRVWNASRV